MASTKLKTLLVYKLLNDYSDENHPLSTPEIIDMLKDYGITCEKNQFTPMLSNSMMSVLTLFQLNQKNADFL